MWWARVFVSRGRQKGLCHAEFLGRPNLIDRVVRRNPFVVLGRRKFGHITFSPRLLRSHRVGQAVLCTSACFSYSMEPPWRSVASWAGGWGMGVEGPSGGFSALFFCRWNPTLLIVQTSTGWVASA